MFSKLRKKIFYSVFFVSLAFVLALSAVSYCLILASVYDSQRNLAASCAVNGSAGCTTYLNTVSGFVESTAGKSAISDATLGIVSPEVISLLDALCNKSVKIDGAILYGKDGYVAYSAGVGAPPSFAELLADENIYAFFVSGKKQFVSVRNSIYAKVYNSAFYDDGAGIISCMSKVLSEDGETAGLLVADILPQTLVNEKLSYSAFDISGEGFIVKDEKTFDTKKETLVFPKMPRITDKYNVSTAEFADGAIIAMRFSLANFRNQAIIIFAAFVGVDILLAFVAYLFSYKLSKSVEEPLDDLLLKMKESSLPASENQKI